MSRNLNLEPEYAELMALWNRACAEQGVATLSGVYWAKSKDGGNPIILEAVLAQFGYYLHYANDISGIDEMAEEYEEAILGGEIMDALTGV